VRQFQRGNIVNITFQWAILTPNSHITAKKLEAGKDNARCKKVAFDGLRIDRIEAGGVAKKQVPPFILIHRCFQEITRFKSIVTVVPVAAACFRVQPGQGIFRSDPQVVGVVFHQAQNDIGVKTLFLIVCHQLRPHTRRVISTKHQAITERT